MDLSKLREVCKTYTAKEYFVEPIPERKARMARESLKVPSSAQIVALIDFTVFGIADDALVIADTGLYWKNTEEDPQRLSWAQFRQREIREKKTFLSKAIDFGNGLEMELSGAASLIEKDNHLVVDLLNEIKSLPEQAFPDSVVRTSTPGATIGLVECEFCKCKVKPYATFCKHCGMKLRG